MKRSIRGLRWTRVGLAMTLVAAPARAAEFHAVITNFGNAPRASAHLDVSVDTRALAGSPVDVVADVFIGTDGATGTGKYSTARIENQTTWRVDLQPDDENSNVIVATNGEVIVQLVVDDGRMR